MAATLKHIAQATGFSISTISRALSGHPRISEATRTTIQRAAHELGYRPNAHARALRNSRTDTIGVIIPNLSDPYFALIGAAIEKEAEQAGVSTVMTASSENPARLADALETLNRRRVDGIIAVPVAGADHPLTYTAQHCPLILIDREAAGLPSVVSDPSPGMGAALEHLKARGHTSIGYIPGPADSSTGISRLAFMRKAATDFDLHVAKGGSTREAGYSSAMQLFFTDMTALVAGDSMMAAGAMDACYNSGVGIGTDLAFIGFDDLDIFRLQPTPISVVDQDMPALGRVATRQLLKAIDTNSTPEGIRLPTYFYPRLSTASAPKGLAHR